MAAVNGARHSPAWNASPTTSRPPHLRVRGLFALWVVLGSLQGQTEGTTRRRWTRPLARSWTTSAHRARRTRPPGRVGPDTEGGAGRFSGGRTQGPGACPLSGEGGLKRRRLNLLHSSLEVAETIVEVRGKLSFGQPTTAASRRTLALPPFLAEELRTHLDRFVTHRELVFAGRDGEPMRRTNFRSPVWLPAVESVGLSPLRFHDLRHTAAGLMIARGAHPKLLQSRLGHSSIQVTFDVYGHLLPALDKELAKALEATRTAALSEKPAAHVLPGSEPRT
jgi:hypothetical protein